MPYKVVTVAAAQPFPTLERALAEGADERGYVEDVLELTDGRLEGAADLAGIRPARMRALVAKHGLYPLLRD